MKKISKVCFSCKSTLFEITLLDDCSDCEHNGAYTDEGYIYDEDEIKEHNLIRDQVENDGECDLGPAWGCGCYMFECVKCKTIFNLGLIDD